MMCNFLNIWYIFNKQKKTLNNYMTGHTRVLSNGNAIGR